MNAKHKKSTSSVFVQACLDADSIRAGVVPTPPEQVLADRRVSFRRFLQQTGHDSIESPRSSGSIIPVHVIK